MSGTLTNRGKAPMTGWFKWVIVVIIPFSALFIETWLNVETIKRDYKIAELNERAKKLRETLDSLKVEAARLENMDRVEIEAPDLGLMPPEPNQVQVFPFDEPEQIPAPETAPTQVVARESRGPEQADHPRLMLAGNMFSPGSGKLWKSDTHTGQKGVSEMMGRLSKAIADACASYFGRS